MSEEKMEKFVGVHGGREIKFAAQIITHSKMETLWLVFEIIDDNNMIPLYVLRESQYREFRNSLERPIDEKLAILIESLKESKKSLEREAKKIEDTITHLSERITSLYRE